MKKLFILSCVLFATNVSANCMQAPITQVNVFRNIDLLNYDNTKNIAEISRMQGNSGNHYGLGLYLGQFGIRVQTQYKTLTNNVNGQVCLSVPVVNVQMFLKPTIYIANDFSNDACAYNTISTHENKHFKYEIDSIEFARQNAEPIVRKYLQGQTYLFRDRATAENEMSEVMKRIQVEISDQFSYYSKQQHKQLDSKEEYARNNYVCNGAIPRKIASLKMAGRL